MGRLMAKMGRPQIEIKQETFEGLCRVQCTLEEISSVLAVSEDTVERWCGRVYQSTFANVFLSIAGEDGAAIFLLNSFPEEIDCLSP